MCEASSTIRTSLPCYEQGLRAVRDMDLRLDEGATCELYAQSPTHQGVPRRWPPLAIVMDIYGRTGRWDEAAQAFEAYIAERAKAAAATARKAADAGKLREPDPSQGELGARYGAGERGNALAEIGSAPAPWSALQPAPFAYTTTAYLKLGRIDDAGLALMRLRATLRSGKDDQSLGAGDGGEGCYPDGHAETLGPDDRGNASPLVTSRAKSASYRRSPGSAGDRDAPLGLPDAAWVEASVRSFVRARRWDLAADALSPEMFGWLAADAGKTDDHDQTDQDALEKLRTSLEPFLHKKANVKRPPRGQKAGAAACLRALKIGMEYARSGGHLPLDSTTTDRGVLHQGVWRTQSALDSAPIALRDDLAGHLGVHATKPSSDGGAAAYVHETLPQMPRVSTGSALEVSDRDDASAGAVRDVRIWMPERRRKSGPSVAGPNEAWRRKQVISAEALLWLFSVEVERSYSQRLSDGAPHDRHAGRFPPGGSSSSSPSPSPFSPATIGSWRRRTEEDTGPMDRLLSSRSAALPAEAVLDAVRRAWPQQSEHAGEGSAESADIRKSAAFALYEAGVEGGAVRAEEQWASVDAGVLDLSNDGVSANHGRGLAALNLALRDMLRQHAHGVEVGATRRAGFRVSIPTGSRLQCHSTDVRASLWQVTLCTTLRHRVIARIPWAWLPLLP